MDILNEKQQQNKYQKHSEQQIRQQKHLKQTNQHKQLNEQNKPLKQQKHTQQQKHSTQINRQQRPSEKQKSLKKHLKQKFSTYFCYYSKSANIFLNFTSKLSLLAVLFLGTISCNCKPPELISQSVTNVPAPSPAESYQLDLMPSEGVSKTLTFMDLMTQRRYGNNIEQCPCIILPGSNKCMVYDSRYQAALIEEAMLTFVDSSMDPRIFEDEMSGQQISYHTLECLTEECRQCVGMLTARLKQVGLLTEAPQYTFPVPKANELRPNSCPRLRIGRPIPQYSPPATKMAPIEQLISAGAPMRLAMQREQFYSEFAHKVNQALNMNHAAGAHPISSLFTNKEIAQKRSSTSSSSTTTTIPLRDGNVPYNNYPSSPPSQIPYRIALKPSQQYQNKWKTNTNYQQNRRNYMRIVDRDILKEGNRRHVRQTKKHERPVIGSRFVINCVERGEPESDQTDQLNLCTACWTWRQLSEEYFPRLINELVCQSSDYCLSGWGTCNQRYRNFDVLQKVTVNGQDEWRPTTISAASCCDCKVKAGSQAHHLVVGGKT